MQFRIPLLKRLVPSLYKRWARLTWCGGFAVVRRHGAYFLLDHRNFVDRQLAFFDHEAAQLDYLMTRMAAARPDVFLDVGANLGLYSVLVAHARCAARVIAVEPDPRNVAQLGANLLLNQLLDRVEIVAKAASERSGPRSFIASAATSTGQSRIGDAPDAISVEGVRLDELVAGGAQTLFAKIDVEGHERSVIAGMATLFRANRVFLQIECFPPDLQALTEMLAAHGFTCVHRIEHDHYFTNF